MIPSKIFSPYADFNHKTYAFIGVSGNLSDAFTIQYYDWNWRDPEVTSCPQKEFIMRDNSQAIPLKYRLKYLFSYKKRPLKISAGDAVMLSGDSIKQLLTITGSFLREIFSENDINEEPQKTFRLIVKSELVTWIGQRKKWWKKKEKINEFWERHYLVISEKDEAYDLVIAFAPFSSLPETPSVEIYSVFSDSISFKDKLRYLFGTNYNFVDYSLSFQDVSALDDRLIHLQDSIKNFYKKQKNES